MTKSNQHHTGEHYLVYAFLVSYVDIRNVCYRVQHVSQVCREHLLVYALLVCGVYQRNIY